MISDWLAHMAGYIIKVTRECNPRCTYCHEWEEFGVHPPLPFRTLVELTEKALIPTRAFNSSGMVANR